MTAMVMNRRALLLALGSTLALGGCLRPSFRTDQLDATGTGSIAARNTLAAGDKLRVIVFGQDNLSNIYAVDGAGRIALPLMKPALGTLGLITFISSWNNFMNPLIVMRTADNYTLPLALRSLDNVLLQPHVAGFTEEAFAAGMDLVRRNLLAHFSGQPLITPIPV